MPDNSTSLAGVAAATTALLLDAGLKPQNAGGGVFVLDAKNFHCDQHLNGALDASNVRAGLPTLKCRINSQNKRGTTAGQPFGEGRAMTELLQKVQGSNPARRRGLQRLRHGLLRHLREVHQVHHRHQDRQFQQRRPVELRFHGRAVTTVRPSRIRPPFRARGRRR